MKKFITITVIAVTGFFITSCDKTDNCAFGYYYEPQCQKCIPQGAVSCDDNTGIPNSTNVNGDIYNREYGYVHKGDASLETWRTSEGGLVYSKSMRIWNGFGWQTVQLTIVGQLRANQLDLAARNKVVEVVYTHTWITDNQGYQKEVFLYKDHSPMFGVYILP